MTERPILFSAPMVRAILEGRKTQTRRVLKPQPIWDNGALGIEDDKCRWIFAANSEAGFADGLPRSAFNMPYAVGDLLWVREVWGIGLSDHGECPRYRATMDYQCGDKIKSEHEGPFKWRSPIHMPRQFSRITLRVTGVKVERVQNISGADTIAEGVQCSTCEAMKVSACHDSGCFASYQAFQELWTSIHGPGSYEANPWVVAISFERVA